MSNKAHIDIDYTARLARLALSDEEKVKFSAQLDSVLGYVEKLEELDTEGVVPTAHPFPASNVWQDDVAGEALPVAETLRNAPDSRNNMIVVPKVVE